MPDTSEIEDRIERITTGLLQETALRADTPQRHALADRMRYFYTPGVSIAVINNYQIEWAHGFGVVEAGKPEPITPDTLFQAGSISKPVAVTAALRLVDEGKLDLDQDVNTYLTSWKLPAGGTWQPRVTLRQLMSHTAGLTVHGFPGYTSRGEIPTLVQVLDGTPPANTDPVLVNAIPGTQFRYSGGGTSIVQLLLMDVLGRPFPDLMRELVLDPLGMEHSTYEQPLPASRAAQAATAHPDDAIPLAGRFHIYPEMAAAGLWTTPSDLARFAIEIQLSLAGRSNKLLSAQIVKEMLTPQVEDHIGLGPFLDGKDDSARFGHGGWDEGFVAQMTAYQRQGFGAVVMLNSNRGAPLLGEITRAVAAEYSWPGFIPMEPIHADLDPDLLAAYAGEYELKPNFHLVITPAENNLAIQPTGQAAIPFYPESETKFFARVVDAEVTFSRTDTGEVTELTFKQNGKEMSAKRNAGE